MDASLRGSEDSGEERDSLILITLHGNRCLLIEIFYPPTFSAGFFLSLRVQTGSDES